MKQMSTHTLLVSGFLIFLLFMSGPNVNLLGLLRRYVTEDVALSIIPIITSNGILFPETLAKLKPAGLSSSNHKFLPDNESKRPEHP
jgi:hypothetical protein